METRGIFKVATYPEVHPHGEMPDVPSLSEVGAPVMQLRPPLWLVLIATSDILSGRTNLLDRMLISVGEAAARSQIALLLLLQNCAGHNPIAKLPQCVTVFRTEEQLPLSAARNRLLVFAAQRGWVHEDSIFLFPDDDCWYPDGALANIATAFTKDRFRFL